MTTAEPELHFEHLTDDTGTQRWAQRGGTSFAEGDARSPPRPSTREVQGRAIDRPVCWVRVRWCRPLLARLENPERVGVQSSRSRGDP